MILKVYFQVILYQKLWVFFVKIELLICLLLTEQMAGEICLVCKKEVTRKEPFGCMDTPLGGVAHYKCVVEYGYDKFTRQTRKSNKLTK